MPTREEYAKQPLEQRLSRMARTADDLAAAIHGQSDAVLSRRPDEQNWAANEVLCHLRDVEEVYLARLQTILLNDELKLYASRSRVSRWADERQYQRSDAAVALGAFRGLRNETLAFMRQRTSAETERACLHPTGGRMTMGDFMSFLAGHDDNHLDQLTRALEGRA